MGEWGNELRHEEMLEKENLGTKHWEKDKIRQKSGIDGDKMRARMEEETISPWRAYGKVDSFIRMKWDQGNMWGKWGVRKKYTLDETAVHQRAPRTHS